MEQTPTPIINWDRMPQRRYGLDIPAPLFDKMEKKAKEKRLTLRAVVIRCLEAAMEAEG